MEIVFDNIVFSLQKSGGVSVVWYELIKRFLEKGNDNIMFIEHFSDYNNILRESLKIPEKCIIPARKIWFALDRYINPGINIQNPFIFHSSYFRTCSCKNAINVTTVHDFTYDYFYKGKRRGAFLHILQRNRAIRNADAIVCISENTKRDLLKFLPDVSPEKIHVIYNGVSSDYKVVDVKIPGISDYLMFVGGRGAYKNGRWLAESIKQTNYKVIFCGQPMNEEEKDFYDSVLGPQRYLMIPYPTNEELNRYYNSVKCLVYPSSYEGFGIPVLEAQRAGCPVIALKASSIPEIIGETPLLMKDLSSDELLTKISVLEDARIRAEIIQKGLINASRFTWDSSFEHYRELYLGLLLKKEKNA